MFFKKIVIWHDCKAGPHIQLASPSSLWLYKWPDISYTALTPLPSPLHYLVVFARSQNNCYGLSKLLSQFLMDMVSDAKVGAAYGSGGPINKARLQTAFVWPADPLLQLTVRRQTQHWQRRKSRCPVINPEVLLPLVHFIITLALWSYCRC